MKAAVLREYGEPLEIEDVPAPDPDPHGVVVETEACGVCRSDWHAWQGHGEWADDRVPKGQILGHEPAGTVVAVGDSVERIREGDRIAVPFNLGRGDCEYCRNGHGNVCAGGLALGFEADAPGAFAERVHVPDADYNAVGLPAGVSPTEMASLGCRFATAYHGLAHRADLAPGDWVAVHGCGGVGLSAVHVADALGANVVAVDLADGKLVKARELGADETVNAGDVDAGDAADGGVPAAIRGLTDGGAHVSVDALGIAETVRNSVACLRKRGQHLQLGLTTDEERGEVSLPTDAMTMSEITFLGSRGMPPTRYDELLRMMDRGTVSPADLVTAEVGLSDVPDRLAAMGDYGTVGIEVVTEF
ncbi:zinc-dependent alcohol dehydrogenase family protein (plasmid) [Halorussus salilacus]|uniref:zinc-dependent alcohol dehydrogenase family protein n=1 Tax=Halorussus salilacus TaxID=2953750 RepID=UPI0020A04B5D|nr:zinc-dependent alcohol dehydrogenase family protein [Halorussus salilacus]USZ69990.1 zinc-dependent alcohol dehydrogenase family protein [Halorussus salilacus]